MGQQSLIYSFVARGTVILAKYTEFTGNFTGIAAQCLQKLPATNNKFTYNSSVPSETPFFLVLVELEDHVENIGAKLVRQAAAKPNDLAGDEQHLLFLAQGLIAEGVKVFHKRMPPEVVDLTSRLLQYPPSLDAQL